MRRLTYLLGMGAALLVSSAVGGSSDPIPSREDLIEYEKILVREDSGRGGTDADQRFGSDPFRILHLAGRQRYLILLRNRSEVLLADSSLNLLDRRPAPRSPTGWTLAHGRFLFVSGELSPEIQLYEITASRLLPRGRLRVGGVASVRDLVYVPAYRSLFLLDDFDRRLHRLELAPDWQQQNGLSYRHWAFPIGAGPVRILHRGGHLLINLLLEHTLLIVPLIGGAPDFSLASRITHHGPIWALDAVVRENSLIIAAGGVEDRPLNRRSGEFGHVDSYLFLYELPQDPLTRAFRPPPAGRPRRLAEQNLSELDVVTPKALRLVSSPDGSLALWVSAFGSARMARFKVENGIVFTGAFSLPPGTTDFAVAGDQPIVAANSLFDRIYRLDARDGKSGYRWARGIPLSPATLSRESRIGEVLFFTTLMTPHNRTAGELSRFTCEACHYEGTIDGRVHYTGRGRVFATTKTLRGLANNVPLFSRAGDRSLASMVLAEFRVANQERRDSFSIETAGHPWLGELGDIPPVLSPRDLRTSFLSFFVDFKHRPNPWRARSDRLDEKAARGLGVFRERCEHCHMATVSTRGAESLPAAQWKEWLEDEDRDLVWGAPFYSKTGIQPYVHRAGARVPSLRRVQQKYPLFTNGSSPTLRHLLDRFRYRGLAAWHHYEPRPGEPDSRDVKALAPPEVDALERLLRFF